MCINKYNYLSKDCRRAKVVRLQIRPGEGTNVRRLPDEAVEENRCRCAIRVHHRRRRQRIAAVLHGNVLVCPPARVYGADENQTNKKQHA